MSEILLKCKYCDHTVKPQYSIECYNNDELKFTMSTSIINYHEKHCIHNPDNFTIETKLLKLIEKYDKIADESREKYCSDPREIRRRNVLSTVILDIHNILNEVKK